MAERYRGALRSSQDRRRLLASTRQAAGSGRWGTRGFDGTFLGGRSLVLLMSSFCLGFDTVFGTDFIVEEAESVLRETLRQLVLK